MEISDNIKALWLLIKDQLRSSLKPDLQRKIDEDQIQRARFFSTFIRPGDLVFDVGANLGNRIGPLLLCKARVIAIEPQYFCYRYLRLRFGGSIRVLNLALGEKEGETEIMLNNSSSTIASMSQEWISKMKSGRFSATSWSRKQKVKVVPVQQLIKKHGMPAFIKIDVEGYEPEVLKGMTEPVPKLSFEYTTPEMTASALACVERLHQLSPAYLFNYAIAENTRFELEEWLPADKFKEILHSNVESLGGFGDIYARIEP